MNKDNNKKNTSNNKLVLAVILIVGIGYFFFEYKALSQNNEEKGQPHIQDIETKTYVLRDESISDEMEFFGNLKPNKEAALSAKTSGRIASLNVKEGDSVKSRQLLAYLYPDQYGLDYKKKNDSYQNFEKYRQDQESYWEKQVDASENNLETKKEERDYYKIYDPSRLEIAEENVDKAESDLEVAKKQRDAQKESLRQQSSGLYSDVYLSGQSVSDTKIYSPFDGIITKKFLEIGEVVSAGQSIVSVADISSFKVIVEVPDSMRSVV